MYRLIIAAVVVALLVVTVAWSDSAKGPITLPPDIELSALTGTAFPEGVLAGCISYRFARFADSEQYVWADAALQLDGLDAGDTSPILGLSTNLPTGVVKSRAGVGIRAPAWSFGDLQIILYTRLAF